MNDEEWSRRTKLVAQLVVSAAVLVACFAIIFRQDTADSKKWAFGMVGLVVGYWLR